MAIARVAKFTEQQYLDAVPGSGGIVTEIARNLDCSRTTVYRAIKEIPKFAEYVQLEKDGIIDAAEFGITHNINVRNAKARNYPKKAIDTTDHKWVLGRKSVGFAEKVDITSAQQPIFPSVAPDKVNETLQRLQEIASILVTDEVESAESPEILEESAESPQTMEDIQ